MEGPEMAPSHDVGLHFEQRVIIRDPIVPTVPEAAEQENCCQRII